MKKMLLTLAAALFAVASVADDRPIDYNQIPQNAKTFLTKYFAKAKPASVTVDDEYTNAEYTVYLDNGAKVEFRKDGSWKEVDCRAQALPAGIVPANIASYVSKNYTGTQIVKIDKDYTDYELRLSNGLELKFDLQGNFLRVDD